MIFPHRLPSPSFGSLLAGFCRGWLGCVSKIHPGKRRASEEHKEFSSSSKSVLETIPEPSAHGNSLGHISSQEGIPSLSHSDMPRCRAPLWNSSGLISKATSQATINTSLSAVNAQQLRKGIETPPKTASKQGPRPSASPQFFAKILLLHRGVTMVLPPVPPRARICSANELLELIKENRLFMPGGVLDGFLQPGGNQALQNPQILALRNADASTNPQLPKITWSAA